MQRFGWKKSATPVFHSICPTFTPIPRKFSHFAFLFHSATGFRVPFWVSVLLFCERSGANNRRPRHSSTTVCPLYQSTGAREGEHRHKRGEDEDSDSPHFRPPVVDSHEPSDHGTPPTVVDRADRRQLTAPPHPLTANRQITRQRPSVNYSRPSVDGSPPLLDRQPLLMEWCGPEQNASDNRPHSA